MLLFGITKRDGRIVTCFKIDKRHENYNVFGGSMTITSGHSLYIFRLLNPMLDEASF